MSFLWSRAVLDNEERVCTKCFPAKLSSFADAGRFVCLVLDKAKVGDKRRVVVETVLEELFVNVVRYAYAQQGGTVTVSCCTDDDSLHLLLTDSGVPFDPFGGNDAKASENVKQMIPGGLGILMVKKLSDAVDYLYANGENRVYAKVRVKEENE